MDQVRAGQTWAEVDLDGIRHNVAELRRLAPSAGLMAVVKADGYGHGATAVAKAAVEAGAAWLGVATLEEAIQLRAAGLSAPILLMGYVSPAVAETVLLYGLTATVFHMELARALSWWAQILKRQAPVHVKVDTGMGRVGLHPDALVPFARELVALPRIDLEGVFTHLATADEPGSEFTHRQIRLFRQSLDALREAGIEPRIRHACNSAGLVFYPEAHFDLVRAGIAIYGLPPNPEVACSVDLRPALTWKTRVSTVKWVESGSPISYGCTYRAAGAEQIATLPVGYADGYSRRLSDQGEVLIQGRRCPVAGRICMNQLMVRVPDGLAVQVGDEAVLIGTQGDEGITAVDLAAKIGTIHYEILCSLSKRVPRLYREDGKLEIKGIL